MEIKIEVNEEQFKLLMEKSLAELPTEKIQEVMLEGMKNYLSMSANWGGVFFNNDYWGKPSVLKPEFLKIMKEAFNREEDLQKIADEIIAKIREEKDEIIISAIKGLIIDGITHDSMFTCRISEAVSRAIVDHQINHHKPPGY